MAVFQLIYTSSKRGYGVFSQSSEIKPDESRQITINTAYKRPQSLINSNETNYRKFPINLSKFRLSNQKWVLAQSSYVGLDNTGRQGNFFTHAFVFPSTSDFSKKYLYYPFRTELTEEEKELVNPSSLPLIGDFDFLTQGTVKFARENSSKLALFIQSFLNAQRGRKKFAIEDSNENIILWIKVLYEILPYKLLEDIEFTTYTDRITSAFDIIGIYDSSIIKDTSRFISFNGKDNSVEVGKFAKSITEDYLTGVSRDLFYFFANSMKREELMQSIDSLYSTLNTNDVSIDDVFSLIKNLPKKDLSIANEVIRFLMDSDFLTKFDESQIQFILHLVEPAENTSSYNLLVSKIAFSCSKPTLDIIIQTIKPSSKLIQELDDVEQNDNISFLRLSFKIKTATSPFRLDRFSDILQSARMISSTQKEWLKTPFNQLIDQLIATFPRNDGEHTESQLKSLVKKIKDLVGDELIYERAANRFRNEMQQMDAVNQLAIRNGSLMLILSGESQGILRILRNYDSKEDQPRLLQILSILYTTLGESVIEDNTLMSQYKILFPVYEQAFDHLSHGKQKNFIRRYRRVFGNKSQLRFRPNYSLLALIGVFVIAVIGGSGFLILDSRPKLINSMDPPIELSAFFGPKIVNEIINENSDENYELVNFENTPNQLLIEISTAFMKDYRFNNGSELDFEVNERSNQVRITPKGGNFLSPVFAVQFEKIELDTSPTVVISGIEYIQTSTVSGVVDYDQIYSRDVYDVIDAILGKVLIDDKTLDEYKDVIGLLGLDSPEMDFKRLSNPDLRRFIRIDPGMFDEFNQRRTNPISSKEELSLIITNHAGNELLIVIEIDIDASNIRIVEEFPYFSDRLIQKIQSNTQSNTPRKDLVADFLISLNILTDDFDIPGNFGSDLLTLESQSGSGIFEIPIKRIASDAIPTIELVDSGLKEIELDWKDLIDINYSELVEKIYIEIGSGLVNDDVLQLVLAEELYRNLVTSGLNEDFSVQQLSKFKHPVLDLRETTQAEAMSSISEDGNSFVFILFVENIYGIESTRIEIIVKAPLT